MRSGVSPRARLEPVEHRPGDPAPPRRGGGGRRAAARAPRPRPTARNDRLVRIGDERIEQPEEVPDGVLASARVQQTLAEVEGQCGGPVPAEFVRRHDQALALRRRQVASDPLALRTEQGRAGRQRRLGRAEPGREPRRLQVHSDLEGALAPRVGHGVPGVREDPRRARAWSSRAGCGTSRPRRRRFAAGTPP